MSKTRTPRSNGLGEKHDSRERPGPSHPGSADAVAVTVARLHTKKTTPEHTHPPKIRGEREWYPGMFRSEQTA